MTDYPRKKLIIAGGGHASLPLIKMGRYWKGKNLSVTLVSAENYLVYSGALPQYLGGFYKWEETAINLEELCSRYGVEFIRARVGSVNRQKNTIGIDAGNELSFDYLLINVGVKTSGYSSGDKIYPVKPMSALIDLKKKLESGDCRKLMILGGGAAGTEIALNLSHPNCTYRPAITIIEKENSLLSGFPQKASINAEHILRNRGVEVLTGNTFKKSDTEPFDAVIMATGNEPESVNISHNFKTGSGNRLLTDRTLLVTGSDCIFAAGDTADVDGADFSQIGVHAVKQGKTLRANIESLLDRKPLNKYSPYSINPLIISDGPDRAIFTAAGLSVTGRAPAVMKYVLDMKWLEKYTMEPENRRPVYMLLKDGMDRSSD
ncbi:NAD(P)/FAD-dependent oxidoreductase [Rhodohalobacter mucosus]|uniref:FAD/NAD(P)-binding domain-containing protein n=1 Tax=Rhodohalobacter mucosus TaxID=2079485 RepID=A0A316TVC3_9BACT|nr:FAD-dependent oxidoreductase [Rhodohalobacter mucosus]PWN07858.1 hypothetical protein DDZ15_02280 [Rhodohalobacter mucosus]